MTTYQDFHLAVRRLVSGRGTFVVQVQSTEHHPGRIDVQWAACILVEGKPSIVAQSISPSVVLERLEDQLQSVVPSLAPAAIRDLGAPLASTGPEAEPVVDLVNVKSATR